MAESVKVRITGVPENTQESVRTALSKLGAEIDSEGVLICVHADGDELSVVPNDEGFLITYSQKCEFFRGLAICINMIKHPDKKVTIKQRRCFNTSGVMLDVSRGVVNSVAMVKDFIEYMALMGHNMIMLYTEDTYKLPGHKWFGYLKGGYSEDDLKEIDTYAQKFGIELIPCIQTLSHLATALRWKDGKKYANSGQTLHVGKNEAYELIEEMLKTVVRVFTTKKVHIGLDEATDISLGAMLKQNGYINPTELMIQHVEKVCDLCKKYGLKPMMWSDMFFKNGERGGDYDETSHIPSDTPERLPENVEMVYWDYCYEDEKHTEKFIKLHNEKIKRKTCFAGGIWTWSRLVPSYVKTFETARGQAMACRKNGIDTVFVTTWNSSCAPWDTYSVLPGIQIWAELTYKETVSDLELAEMFEICTDCALDDFLAIGVDDFSTEDREKYMDPGCFCVNSSAQHFFDDILYGLYEKTLSGYDFKSHYKKYVDLTDAIKHKGKFSDMFYQANIFARLMYQKCDIGLKLRNAYADNDKNALKECIKTLNELLALYEEYHRISYKIWHKNNSPFGWEGCDMTLSCMEARVKNAIRRVSEYINGDVSELPELSAEIEYYNGCRYPLTESGRMMSITSPGYGV